MASGHLKSIDGQAFLAEQGMYPIETVRQRLKELDEAGEGDYQGLSVYNMGECHSKVLSMHVSCPNYTPTRTHRATFPRL